MGKSYIPQYIYIVCIFLLNPTPQRLIVTKSKTSVFHKGESLFTVQDKNADAKLICKSPMRSIMLIARLITEMILTSNPIGWVIIGICAGSCYRSIVHNFNV